MITALEATKGKHKQAGSNAPASIPKPIQVLFMHAIESLWLRELRHYFQNIAKGFQVRDDDVMGNHPDFPKAVLAAVRKKPALKQIDSFGRGWDLARFVTAIAAMKKKDHLAGIKDMSKLVKEWGDLRNPLSHESHVSNAKVFSNRDLMVYITTATNCVINIRCLSPDSPRAKDIFHKLLQLENCLSAGVYMSTARMGNPADSDVKFSKFLANIRRSS